MYLVPYIDMYERNFSSTSTYSLFVGYDTTVINLVPVIVQFFTTTRRTGFTYRCTGFVPFWISKNKKNIEVQKFEILFKFAYTERYLTENTGTARYLAIQASIWPVQSRILTCTLFLPVWYGAIFITMLHTLYQFYGSEN